MVSCSPSYRRVWVPARVPSLREVMGGGCVPGIPVCCWSSRAVPDGASRLVAWCSSTMLASNPGRPCMFSASARALRRKRCTPTEKLAAWSNVPPCALTSAAMRGSSWCHPVVPQTVGMPSPISFSRLVTAASGRVNSMATSHPASLSRVNARPPAFSAEFTLGMDGMAPLRRQGSNRLAHAPDPNHSYSHTARDWRLATGDCSA